MKKEAPNPDRVAQAHRMRAARDAKVCEKGLREWVNDVEDLIFDNTYIDGDFNQVVNSQILLAGIYTLMRERGISPNHDAS